MELTQQCIEEIIRAAREVDSGVLTITIQVRPEDNRAFDFKCEYEKRFRVSRSGKGAIPTTTPGMTILHDRSYRKKD
jgi:hypothetical protein